MGLRNAIFIFSLTILAMLGQSLNDNVKCVSLQNSTYGHVSSCVSQKPLPVKTQTTFTFDKQAPWTNTYYVGLLDATTNKSVSLGNCFQGRPRNGNRTAGENITLGLLCNVLPRALKANDLVIYYIFYPESEILKWGIPLPGYSTSEDVQIFLSNKANDQDIKVMQDIAIQAQTQKQQFNPKKINQIKHLNRKED